MPAFRTLNSTVQSWTDSQAADTFRDEDGGLWRTFADAVDGTIAVQEFAHDGDDAPVLRAGVFTWDRDSNDTGTITPKDDGATYGVNCEDEYIVRGGEWVENTDAE